MTIDFHSKTSDELRDLIARGIFPPVAGADGAEGDATPAEPEAPAAEEAPTVGEVFDRHANPEAPAEPEAAAEPEPEAEPEGEPEGEVEGVDLEQYNLALEVALDEDDPQYDTAVEILRENAPESVLRAYGLTADAEVDDEPDDVLGDDATGIPEIDAALREVREFKRDMEQGRTQAQQEAEEAAEAAAREAFESDFKELAGDEAPLALSEMNRVQQGYAVALLGVDGVDGIDDPKAFVAEMFKEMREEIKVEAIQEYIDGKSDFKLPPATGRNGSTTAKIPATRQEAMAGLGAVFDRHANGAGEVSG